MKKLLIIPIVLVCLTGASTSNNIQKGKDWQPVKQDKTEYHLDVKVDRLDSLLRTL